jgi:hypothetical protein
MKKILVCNKGMLKEWYGQAAPDGGPLRLRRLAQAGRLELLQITNDPPPYWFVMIRYFDMSEKSADRKALACFTTSFLGNGVWRFLEFEKARTKFVELSTLPIFVAEALKARETREKLAQRMKEVRSTSPLGL